MSTTGNEDCHLILRGGKTPNYSAEDVESVGKQLVKSGHRQKVMIDFSHANSLKQFKRQLEVANDISAQVSAGDHRIFGVMIESHLIEGNQNLVDTESLTFGQSITDACIGWEDTECMLSQLASAVRQRRKAKF